MKHIEAFTYTPQIPTGTARTKGYGNTVHLLVILAPNGFKTRNSKHHVVYDGGWCRSDYGGLRGKYRRERELMSRALIEFCKLFPTEEDKNVAYENKIVIKYDSVNDCFYIKQ